MYLCIYLSILLSLLYRPILVTLTTLPPSVYTFLSLSFSIDLSFLPSFVLHFHIAAIVNVMTTHERHAPPPRRLRRWQQASIKQSIIIVLLVFYLASFFSSLSPGRERCSFLPLYKGLSLSLSINDSRLYVLVSLRTSLYIDIDVHRSICAHTLHTHIIYVECLLHSLPSFFFASLL